jgi:large subunit ribosomal protein L22
MAVQAHATAKYIRTSAQKAGLVLDLIRGRDVNAALATLQFARKGVARDIEKVLRSAIANASQKDGFGGDVERLFVTACYANQGPSQKRIRPAPMGRAFRIVKRTAHLTVQVAERPTKVSAPAAPGGDAPRRPRGAKPKTGAQKTAASGRAKAAGKAKTADAGTRAGTGKKKSADRAKKGTA